MHNVCFNVCVLKCWSWMTVMWLTCYICFPLHFIILNFKSICCNWNVIWKIVNHIHDKKFLPSSIYICTTCQYLNLIYLITVSINRGIYILYIFQQMNCGLSLWHFGVLFVFGWSELQYGTFFYSIKWLQWINSRNRI